MTAFLRRAFYRIASLFNRNASDADRDLEFASHLQMSIDENLRAGMPPAEARRQAMIEFGGIDQAKESHHAERGLPFFDRLMQDIRYTLRTLRRDFGFAFVAVLILGLGIGANIVVFSLVNTILLRPMPFYDPSRLTWIAPANPTGLSSMTYGADAFEDFHRMNHSWIDATAYYAFSGPDNMKLTGQGIPQPATAIPVAGNFLHVLGVQPFLGRDFIPSEYVHGAPQVVELSYFYWKSQFHGDAAIVGKTVSMNNTPTTIVGVLPQSFDFGSVFAPGSRVDMLTPVIMRDISPQNNTLLIIGRLKPGVTIAQARDEARTLFPQLYSQWRYPQSKGSYTAYPVFLTDHVTGQLRRSLFILWAAVGVILLIVCVNLANLMMARAAARSREFALRVALGAGRGRLIGQLITEASVLSFFGAIVGLAVAFGVTTWLAHQGSIALPLLSSLHVDGNVLLWTLVLAIAASLIFGLTPGLSIAAGNLQEFLKDSGHGTTGRRHEGTRTALVIAEVALACILVVGAGLLLRSFMHVMDVDLGFDSTRAYTMQVDGSNSGKTNAEHSAWLQALFNSVSQVPGVDAVGLTDNIPLARNRSWGAPMVKGKSYRPGELPDALVYITAPGYVKAMGMRIRGRDFDWTDTDKTHPVIIITKNAAEYLFPGQDPLGRMVVNGNSPDMEIVGVIDNVSDVGVENSASWEMFLPMTQVNDIAGLNLIVRSKVPGATLGPAVLQKVRDVAPGQPNVPLESMQTLVDHSTSPRRFFAMLVAIFAGFGLALASLGIYGVISYNVTRKTQEIGIRMALGASRGDVQRSVILRTLRLAFIGVAIGSVASLIVARAIRSMLFGTQPSDPITFAGMAIVLIAVAAFAGWLPARRASQVNPMTALRND